MVAFLKREIDAGKFVNIKIGVDIRPAVGCDRIASSWWQKLTVLPSHLTLLSKK